MTQMIFLDYIISMLWGRRAVTLSQYYMKGWGGVSRDPNFELHNTWTAPHEVTSGRCLSLATILKVVFI